MTQKEPKKRTSVRISRDHYRQIRILAADQDMPTSRVLDRIIEAGLAANSLSEHQNQT